MGNFIDLQGQRFGRLVVIKRAENIHGKVAWVCKCDCGNIKTTLAKSLRAGTTSSCGCLHKEILILNNKQLKAKHLKTGSSIYSTWRDMKARCYNNKSISYKNYGGRGIKIYDEWLDKEKRVY